MAQFDCLIKSKKPKRKYFFDVEELYRKNYDVNNKIDYEYLESLNIQDLQRYNNKKYSVDLVSLWAKLEMKTYIDFQLGNTVNLYFTDSYKQIPINTLPDYDYMNYESRKLNLLDIKHIKNFKLANITLENIYLAIFEIMDKNNEYRPYVIFYTKDIRGKFIEYCYGYDSNNNGDVELFINSFNYPVFLTNKGYIKSPLANLKTKLNIYDSIDDEDIKKILIKK